MTHYHSFLAFIYSGWQDYWLCPTFVVCVNIDRTIAVKIMLHCFNFFRSYSFLWFERKWNQILSYYICRTTRISAIRFPNTNHVKNASVFKHNVGFLTGNGQLGTFEVQRKNISYVASSAQCSILVVFVVAGSFMTIGHVLFAQVFSMPWFYYHCVLLWFKKYKLQYY